MIKFKCFTLSAGSEWKFTEFDSIIIGKHELDGTTIQISSAYNHPVYFYKEHEEGLFVAKQFASLEKRKYIQSKVLVDNEYKIGAIDVDNDNTQETFFYVLNNGNATVAVLQNSTASQKHNIVSMLSTIEYHKQKKVSGTNA